MDFLWRIILQAEKNRNSTPHDADGDAELGSSSGARQPTSHATCVVVRGDCSIEGSAVVSDDASREQRTQSPPNQQQDTAALGSGDAGGDPNEDRKWSFDSDAKYMECRSFEGSGLAQSAKWQQGIKPAMAPLHAGAPAGLASHRRKRHKNQAGRARDLVVQGEFAGDTALHREGVRAVDGVQRGSSLSLAPLSSGFTLAFDHVSLEERPALLRRKRPVISDVSGYFRCQSVCAVLSSRPMVARKMLLALAGIEQRVSGSIMGNGYPVVSVAFRKHVAYISSLDVCIPQLTVRDSLLFSARMRLDTYDLHEIVRLPAEVADLVDFLDTRVEQLTRAQLFRVAVAMELVLHPSVVFLEHPMDYHSVTEVASLTLMLRGLTHRMGCLVVLSGDGLPWMMYEAVSSFLLLNKGGRVVFSGRREAMELFFEAQLGFTDAKGESLGDLLVQLDDEDRASAIIDAFATTQPGRQVLDDVDAHRRAVASDGFAYIPVKLPPPPPAHLQLLLMVLYACRQSFVRRRSRVIAWASLFVVLLLLGIIMGGGRSSQDDLYNKRGMVFFILSSTVHLSTIFIEDEVREFYLFVHLRHNNYFRTWQYFIATVVRLLLPHIAFCVCLLSTFFFFRFAPLFALLVGLNSFAWSALTVLLVYLHPGVRGVWLLENAYYAYCVILSGFLICLPTVPTAFSTFSLLRISYGGALAGELRGNGYSCDTSTSLYCYTGDQYLLMEGFQNDTVDSAIRGLFLTVVTLLALVFITMHWAYTPSP